MACDNFISIGTDKCHMTTEEKLMGRPGLPCLGLCTAPGVGTGTHCTIVDSSHMDISIH